METRERLCALIESREDLSYTNVSKRAGLSGSAVHKYCTGQVRSMTLDNLEKIAGALDVDLRWLLFGEDGTNITSIFDRIPHSRRRQALDILETFTRKAK